MRRAVGRPFDVEWLGCSIWTRRSLVARSIPKDACSWPATPCIPAFADRRHGHEHPGIGDAWSISSWKLAAVAQGWARAASASRATRSSGSRSVFRRHQQHCGLSISPMENSTTASPAIEDDSDEGRAVRAAIGPELVREVGTHVPHHRGCSSATRYEDSPIIVPDWHTARADDPEKVSSPRRGAPRAPPHCWRLKDGSSMLDLYGPA